MKRYWIWIILIIFLVVMNTGCSETGVTGPSLSASFTNGTTTKLNLQPCWENKETIWMVNLPLCPNSQ